MRIESRELLAVGIFGRKSRIGDRIELLLQPGRTFSSQPSPTGIAASAFALSVLLLASALAPRWLAFAQQQQPRPEFEVASVKPNTTNERGDYGLRGDRIFGRNIPAKGWIQIAYGVKDFQIAGPAWISSEKFDIEARADNPSTSPRQMLLMLQSLLADRFQLTLRREMKDLPVYALVVSRGGLKMKPSRDQTLWAGDFPDGAPNGQPVTGASPRELGPGRFIGEAIPITEFVNLLAGPLGRQVVNKTGLTGRFDIDLRYAPGSGQASPNDADQSPPDASTPSLFTAIQQQLGLRLESTKAPVETLVIDHVEKPDAN